MLINDPIMDIFLIVIFLIVILSWMQIVKMVDLDSTNLLKLTVKQLKTVTENS